MEDFRAIILGSDENAYGAARSFYALNGVKPLLVCTRDLPVTKGSRILETEPVPGIDTQEVFARVIPDILKREKQSRKRLFLIPCADYYAALCIKNRELICGLADNPFITPELYEKLETKDKFLSLCDEYGLTRPGTAVIEYEDRLKNDDFGFGYPVVLKPENSNSYEYLHCSFEGRKKVYYIQNREEYVKTVTSLTNAGYKGKLVVQEYIPGGDGDLYVMNCYSGADGKVRMMCLGQAVMEECAPGMRGNYAAVMTRCDEALYGKIKDFLEKIHYVGFANIDMKFDRRKGDFAVFEINPRHGRSSFYTFAGGLNLMSAVVREPEQTVLGKKTGLWSAVPKCVISKHCAEPGLRAEALELWKKQGAVKTLFEKRDKAVMRYYNSLKRYWYSVKTFNTYYKDKNGST